MAEQYDEILVVLAAAPQPPIQDIAVEKGTTTVKKHEYDAFIYTDLKADGLAPVDHKEAGQPKSIAGLPLAGKGQVIVNWTRYQNYIFTFFRGETAARAFLRGLKKRAGKDETSNELFEVKGSFLTALFDQHTPRERPTHVWWHSELAELVALPWELMIHARSSETMALAGVGSPSVSAVEPVSFSFTRGLPPQTPRPKVLVNGPLRLAFIHEPRSTSKALLEALPDSLLPGIEVTDMTGPPRAALHQAAAEGYEIIHLVTDGAVSLANDGTLYLRKSPKVQADPGASNSRVFRTLLLISQALNLGTLTTWLGNALEAQLDIDKCSPSELSEILRGSRVSILSLSAPKTTDTEPDRLDGYLLPKVYRAFCSLGSSVLPLPTIVAPVGATDDPEMASFWRSFYTDLGQHFEISGAMANALKNQPVAMALFLRHPDGEVFQSISAEEKVTVIDTTQIDAALQLSQELVAQLTAQHDQSEPMPASFKKLLSKELDRQARFKSQLKPWIQTGRDNLL